MQVFGRNYFIPADILPVFDGRFPLQTPPVFCFLMSKGQG